MNLRVLAVIALLFHAALPAQDASPVRVAVPIERGLSEQLLLTGSLTARQDASLSARAAGLVAEVLVDVGDQVKKDQALIRLDPALAKHELAQREATLLAAQVARDEAERQVREAERLAAEKLFPQTELELRRASLAQAEAALAQARASLSQQQETLARHTLVAPFDGVIARRMTDVGEYVSLGTPVLQLVALNHLYLDVQVPQEYFPALDRLRGISVRPDLQPDETFSANLLAAVPVSDASARSFQARLEVDDADQLLPGTSASVTMFFEQEGSTVPVVPPDALLRHPDGNYSLFTVRDGTAVRHVVRIGRSNEDGVEIIDGLPVGEPVVIRGNEILRDGQAVRVTIEEN